MLDWRGSSARFFDRVGGSEALRLAGLHVLIVNDLCLWSTFCD